MRASTLLLVSALGVAAGCQEPRSIEGPPLDLSGAGPAFRDPRVLSAVQLRDKLARIGHPLADSLSTPIVADMEMSAMYDPNDPSTWPRTQIIDERADAVFRPGETFAYAFMRYNGMAGEIALTATLTDSVGRTIELFGPDTQYGLNLGAMNVFMPLDHSVDFNPSSPCGLTMMARAAFKSYNFLFPFPAKLGPFNIPRLQYGTSHASASDLESAPTCRTEVTTGNGGGGGGDDTEAGLTYAVYACQVKDWYWPDGTYWFTQTISCTIVATYTIANQT
jgi:hypothetical protein